MKSSQVFLRDPCVSNRLQDRTGTLWCPPHTQAFRAAERPCVLGARAPHSFCPPLKPADPSYRHTVRRGGSKSVEPQVTSDHLDFRFLRASSALEKINGELLYRCASCLWYYPSLSSLQTHITLGWKEGFSCRVYYRKLKEICCRSDMKKVQGRSLEANTKRNNHFSARNKMERGAEELRHKSNNVEEAKRNAEVQKWLSEIEDPTDHCNR